jgi:urease accessory protein
VSTTHQDGLLAVRMRCDARRRTVLAERRQRFPLRMTVPMYLDPRDAGMAFVYVQNPTGAVYAGDRLETSVAAEPGARVHLTTQSATKISRMDGGEAVQELRVDVGEGAYVEYVPDPIIPQAGARLVQDTIVELAEGGAFVAAETLAPGRRARGERFAYERIRLRLEARRDGRELCVDTMELVPARRPPAARGLLGAGDYLVSLVVLCPERDTERLAAVLDEQLAGRAGVVGAADELPGAAGAVVRVLAPTATAARRALLGVWAVARSEVAGLPLPSLRK